MQPIIEQLSPILVNVLATLIGLALTWASAKFAGAQAAIQEKTGIDAQKLLTDALHRAMDSGVALAKSKSLTNQAAVNMAVDYVKNTSPDLVAKINPSAGALMELAKVKLAQSVGIR